jgi:kynurenine formamidase
VTTAKNNVSIDLEILRIPRTGRLYDLDSGRWHGMPIPPIHPPFQLLTYRSPAGLRAEGNDYFGRADEDATGMVSDLLIAGTHSGTHIDALGHIVCGPGSSGPGDFGIASGDSDEIPPMICRGILVDVAAAHGQPALPPGHPISVTEFEEIGRATGFTVRSGDVVLFRTGCMSFWPHDYTEYSRRETAGVSEELGRHLATIGVMAVGADTNGVEVKPEQWVGQTFPVHRHLLVERGIYLIESMNLEELGRDGVTEFMFVAVPSRIRGATAAMTRPLAIV